MNPRRLLALPSTAQTIILALVMIGLAEGAVRLRAWYRHGSASTVADIFEETADGRRRARPGATLTGSTRKLRVNGLGYRGPDVSTYKPPGTLRVAALGDSVTFGMEASNDASVWPARLQARLDRPDRHVEVINTALPGYTLESSRAALVEDLLPLDIDLVVVMQMAGDLSAHARRQWSANPASESQSEPTWADWIDDHSLLLNLLRVNSAGFRSWLQPAQRPALLDDRGVSAFRRRLEDLVRYARARDIRVALCTVPRAFGDPSAPTSQALLARSALAQNPMLGLEALNDAFDRYNDTIRNVAKAEGILLVDLDRQVPRRSRYFVDAIHLNDDGHALVADLLARSLTDLAWPERVASHDGP